MISTADKLLRAGARAFLPAWEAASRFALGRFRASLVHGPARNAGTLRRVLARNGATAFGRRHDFAGLARAADVERAYRRAVPLATYADLAPDIGRMAAGEPDVLVAGRPPLFVSTSGTTGDPKLFPLTLRQQNEALRFMALLTPAARAEAVPGLGLRPATALLLTASRAGRATAGGTPVGNPSGSGIRRILRVPPPFWVFPPEVLAVADHPSALYLHALFALRAPHLQCIEAIYASHVLAWMGLVTRRGAELVADLARGTLSPDLVLAPAERAAIGARLAPDPARARAVEHALSGGGPGLMGRLWPDLRVLSTVVTGAFAVAVPALRALAGPRPAFYTTCFGATEGMVGINLDGSQPEHYAFALGAGCFELLPWSDDAGGAPADTVGLGEAEPGGLYELVLTTHAGLYRYRLGDVVRIAGREGATPLFAFHHRLGNVIDLVGEKVTEQHLRAAVAAVLGELPGGAGGLVDFAVWPDTGVLPHRYVLYLEPDPGLAGAWPGPAALATRFDAALARIHPAYRTLARDNGRLDAPVARYLAPGAFARLLDDRRRALPDGASANQVKVPPILRSPDLRASLEREVATPRGALPILGI